MSRGGGPSLLSGMRAPRRSHLQKRLSLGDKELSVRMLCVVAGELASRCQRVVAVVDPGNLRESWKCRRLGADAACWRRLSGNQRD